MRNAAPIVLGAIVVGGIAYYFRRQEEPKSATPPPALPGDDTPPPPGGGWPVPPVPNPGNLPPLTLPPGWPGLGTAYPSGALADDLERARHSQNVGFIDAVAERLGAAGYGPLSVELTALGDFWSVVGAGGAPPTFPPVIDPLPPSTPTPVGGTYYDPNVWIALGMEPGEAGYLVTQLEREEDPAVLRDTAQAYEDYYGTPLDPVHALAAHMLRAKAAEIELAGGGGYAVPPGPTQPQQAPEPPEPSVPPFQRFRPYRPGGQRGPGGWPL